MIEALDSNYLRVLSDLNVEAVPQVTIKIWQDYESFLDVLQIANGGRRMRGPTGYLVSDAEIRIMTSSDKEDSSIDLVHEFVHVVSKRVKSDFSNNPRWLWEGVALYVAGDSRKHPTTIGCMTSREFPSIEELNVGVAGSLRNRDCNIYAVGYFLIEYIESTWGMQSVISLVRSNGDIRNTLGTSLEEFESGWHDYLTDTYLN
jgi:hypothetical protein